MGHRKTGCGLALTTGHTLLTSGIAFRDTKQASSAQGP